MWKRLFCTCCRVVVSFSVHACQFPFVHFDILEVFVMAAVPLLLFNDFYFQMYVCMYARMFISTFSKCCVMAAVSLSCCRDDFIIICMYSNMYACKCVILVANTCKF